MTIKFGHRYSFDPTRSGQPTVVRPQFETPDLVVCVDSGDVDRPISWVAGLIPILKKDFITYAKEWDN